MQVIHLRCASQDDQGLLQPPNDLNHVIKLGLLEGRTSQESDRRHRVNQKIHSQEKQ